MKKLLATISLAIMLFSCSNDNKQQDGNSTKDTVAASVKTEKPDSLAGESFYKFVGDSVLILPFEIAISLSPRAEEKLAKGRETIIVDVFFNGTPKDSAHAKFEEDGSFYVASAKKEIIYGQVAKFDGITFSKKIYDQLADKDIDLGVNVYSGRKSSPDNLLDCESLFDKISKVVNKKFTLKGKLIYGDE